MDFEFDNNTIEFDMGNNILENSNYEKMTNKPQINGVELSGNKSLDDLGAQPKGDYIYDSNYVHTDNNFTDTDKTNLDQALTDINTANGKIVEANDKIVEANNKIAETNEKIVEITNQLSGLEDLLGGI